MAGDGLETGVGRRPLMSGLALGAAGAMVMPPPSAAGGIPGRRTFGFQTVDVFSSVPFRGNPVSVILGADDLSDAEMALISKWTNLSETTFLVRPTRPEADYRVRIFGLGEEFPFAGHPTLGTCHAWLAGGGKPKGEGIVQECGVGLVRLRRDQGRLAFAAPPLRKSEPLAPEILARIQRGLGLSDGEITASRRIDNGLEFVVVVIPDRDRLLALKPDWAVLKLDGLAVVAPWRGEGRGADFEVRAFDPTLTGGEDPVTGSLNASLAQWLMGEGLAPSHYVVSQGTHLGREGRVHLDRASADIWVGGDTVGHVAGRLTL